MKNIPNIIVSVIVTFLITLGLDYVLQLITQPNGAIRVGTTIEIRGQLYVPVDIVNYQEKIIDNLILSIPGSTVLSDSVSSTPIQMQIISTIVGNSNTNHVQIIGVEPHSVANLLIPIDSPTKADLVYAVNTDQVKMTIEQNNGLLSPSVKALQNAAVTIVIYSLFFTLAAFWVRSQILDIENKSRIDLHNRLEQSQTETNRIGAELEKAKAEFDASKGGLETLSGKLEQLNVVHTRMTILTMAKLRDYSMELNFWRDTIRKILYQSVRDAKVAETIIDQITTSLKTYQTRSDAETGFETLNVMAGLIAQSEKE